MDTEAEIEELPAILVRTIKMEMEAQVETWQKQK